MPRFKVAHIRQQGVDLIIVPLDDNFHYKTRNEQVAAKAELQARASNAGLAGAVVPVWETPDGRMAFDAPQNWHPFFKSIDLGFVLVNINRELYW